jgi:hypothetical protein
VHLVVQVARAGVARTAGDVRRKKGTVRKTAGCNSFFCFDFLSRLLLVPSRVQRSKHAGVKRKGGAHPGKADDEEGQRRGGRRRRRRRWPKA